MVTKKEISKVMAALGKRGGKVKSEAKTAAVKKNASKGGIARANKYKRLRGAEPAATSVTDSENTENDSGASPELLPTQLPKE